MRNRWSTLQGFWTRFLIIHVMQLNWRSWFKESNGVSIIMCSLLTIFWKNYKCIVKRIFSEKTKKHIMCSVNAINYMSHAIFPIVNTINMLLLKVPRRPLSLFSFTLSQNSKVYIFSWCTWVFSVLEFFFLSLCQILTLRKPSKRLTYVNNKKSPHLLVGWSVVCTVSLRKCFTVWIYKRFVWQWFVWNISLSVELGACFGTLGVLAQQGSQVSVF